MILPELWVALLSKEYYLAIQMINHGADINELAVIDDERNYQVGLMHYAVVETSDVLCIRLLAHLGANVNVRDTLMNNTPLHWAAETGAYFEVTEVLIDEGAIVDARNVKQETPLHRHAANKENGIEPAQILIARGASIDAVNNDGMSVLHLALVHHNSEMVKMLISHGVNIDAKDNDGYSPLLRYVETEESDLEIIQLLLDNGADVNATNNGSLFPLIIAAKTNQLNSLHLLLRCGGRVNQAINTGETALHVACEYGLADVTALLLKFGADLNARNQKGKTPFELLPNSPSSEVTAQIIIKEAVKREVLLRGYILCEGYKKMIQSCENYLKFEQKCHEEFKRMRKTKIDLGDSAVSFFYIFSIDEAKLTALARNQKIISAFESTICVESFTIYGSDLIELQTKCEIAKKQANFLMELEFYLGCMFGDRLPAVAVEMIAAFYVNAAI